MRHIIGLTQIYVKLISNTTGYHLNRPIYSYGAPNTHKIEEGPDTVTTEKVHLISNFNKI